jgi:hypothetical protein
MKAPTGIAAARVIGISTTAYSVLVFECRWRVAI